MKNTNLLFVICIFILTILSFGNNVFAKELDEILNYEVTVDPRMNDGTLDITYEITWKVLDSTSEGPLTWVQIGTPNESFDNAKALSNNIKNIVKYNGAYVKIDFKKAYETGDELTFKYSIHQSYVHGATETKCKYDFTPAWFTDIKVNNMKIKWNATDVTNDDSTSQEGNYLVWTRKNMAKGEKLNVNVEYEKSSFSSLKNYTKSNNYSVVTPGGFAMIVVIIIVAAVISSIADDGYGSHRGFYGGRIGRGGGCACACAGCASCACACACAGSGRAGCSKKDFYGTKLTKEKINNILK